MVKYIYVIVVNHFSCLTKRYLLRFVGATKPIPKTVLKPGEKMMDSHDEVEETEDGQKVRFHYEKIVNEAKDEFSISVSSDVLDTAEDMAEAMADIPAKVLQMLEP